MNKGVSPFLRVPLKEQMLFARNIALMVKTGLPLLDSLQMMQRQTQSASLKKILASVISDVENGQFLSTSLKKYERIFGALFINIIRIGEASGTLSENLSFLADELKKKAELRSKIMNAMLYPAVIVMTTIALTSVLMFVVFPKILPIFNTFNIKLPLSTRILIAVNTFLTSYWLYFILVLIIIGVGLYFLTRVPPIKFRLQKSLLYIPVLGPMIKSVQMAIVARTLALLLKSGVRIVEALSITAEVIPNLAYKKAMVDASEQVKLGAPLGKYFASYPKVFPLMFAQMIEVSETAGTLDTTLQYLSTHYENEVDEATRNMVAMLEPLLMVTMGGVVGFMATAIILPIYSISQSLGN